MKKNNPEITAAAVKFGGQVFTGWNHDQAMDAMGEAGLARQEDFDAAYIEYGFLDENGKFYDRFAAPWQVVKSGQKTRREVTAGSALSSLQLW